jgi:hypothetical protein
MKNLILLFLSLGLLTSLNAQTPTPVIITNAPRTYFDAFYATPDVLLIKGMSTIGTLANQINYPVDIRAERLSNMQTSNTVYAVSLRTRVSRVTQLDYIDYDELDGLIRALQQISQATSSVTPMDNFEALYRTRSGLSIFKVNAGTKLVVAMRSGDVNGVRNEMATFVIDDFTRLLTTAKAKIDSIVASGQ